LCALGSQDTPTGTGCALSEIKGLERLEGLREIKAFAFTSDRLGQSPAHCSSVVDGVDAGAAESIS
jgi:hypothetical protein